MKLRKSALPNGWYPRSTAEITEFLSPIGINKGEKADAAIAPHAGWYYSGKIAAKAVSSLNDQIDTLAVIGGHLPKGFPVLFAMEDAVETPFGEISIDTELRNVLLKNTSGEEDRYIDNTVEILLPMVHYYLPDTKLLWLRLPAEIESYETGKTLAVIAKQLGRKIGVLASTDLTHYGANYGFMPMGAGKRALQWVREVNDRRFLEAIESGDPALVLERANADSSACSAGAVLGAMGFDDDGTARLLEYGTSADADPGEIPGSFVGYAAMAFKRGLDTPAYIHNF